MYLEVINKRTTLEARIEKEQELVNKRIKMEEWDAAKQTEEQTLAQLLIEKAEMERTIKQEETKLEKEQAATIAAHLHEGDACPVCGSQSHPVLAKFGETADLETLEIAKAKLQEKQLVITTTEKAISQLEWQLNEWADMKEQSLAEIQQTLAENIQLATNLREQITQLQSEVAQKETVQATLESLKNRQNETLTEKNKMALEVEKLHQQVQLTEGKRTYLEQSIPDELRDKAVFDNKMKELSSKIETHIKQAEQIDALFRQAEKETTRLESTLHSAQKTTVDAKEALQVQREIFKEAMKQNDFLSYDAYKQALLSVEELKKLRRKTGRIRAKTPFSCITPS